MINNKHVIQEARAFSTTRRSRTSADATSRTETSAPPFVLEPEQFQIIFIHIAQEGKLLVRDVTELWPKVFKLVRGVGLAVERCVPVQRPVEVGIDVVLNQVALVAVARFQPHHEVVLDVARTTPGVHGNKMLFSRKIFAVLSQKFDEGSERTVSSSTRVLHAEPTA